MRTVWHRLAWKEWHEHKWKLASLTTIVLSVASIPLLDFERVAFAGATLIAVLATAPLSLFIGAGEAAGERARGTLAFTQALPVPMWKVALHKLVFGLLTCFLPVAITLAVLAGFYLGCHALNTADAPRLIDPFRDISKEIGLREWLTFSALGAVATTSSLFLWTAAIGANRKDEVSAGAWALLAIVVYWTAVMMIRIRNDVPRPSEDPLISLLYAASPGGYSALEFEPGGVRFRWLALPIALAVHAGLAAWYVLRFGRLANLGIQSPRPAVPKSRQLDWLAPPRRSPLSAITWKQLRESGPIVLAGLAGVIGFTVLFRLAISDETLRPQEYAILIASITAYFGVLVTLVVGIGLFWQDLTPKLNTFWRSRPIDPDAWFWTKLLAGLGVLLVTFGVPMLVAGLAAWYGHPDFEDSARFFALASLLIYPAAVMTTCLVRHAVYAAILSFAVMYSGLLLVIGAFRLTGLALGWAEFEGVWDRPTTAETTRAMIFTTVVCTLVAWLAVRLDWGRKSRY